MMNSGSAPFPSSKMNQSAIPGNYPHCQFYIKNLAGGSNNDFRNFLVTITQLPGEEHEQLRIRNGKKRKCTPAEKKRWSVHAEGVVDRLNKIPQYTPQEKEGYSKPQSTTYIDITKGIEPPLFTWGGDNAQAEVAFMFSPQHVLVNRLWIYSGGTVHDTYSFETKAEADIAYYNWVKGPNRTLFATTDELTNALISRGRRTQLTEAVARLSFQFEGCAIAISTQNIESRWLAMGYAERLVQRLQYRELAYKRTFPEGYEVPIYYYLPKDMRHLKAYSPFERARDRESARIIFANTIERETRIACGRAEFLLCLDNVDEVLLKTTYGLFGRWLMATLMNNARAYIVEMLFLKASRQAQEAFVQKARNESAFSSKVIDNWISIRDNEIDELNAYPILREARSGHWDKVLCSFGKEDYHGLLYLAVQQQQYEHAHAILDKTALRSDRVYLSKDGQTLFHLLMMTNQGQLVKRLMQQPWAIHALQQKDKKGITPLYLAAKQQRWELVLELIKTIASPDVCAMQYEAVLFLAIGENQETVINAIISKLKTQPVATSLWVDPEYGNTVFHQAVRQQNKKYIEALWECYDIAVLETENKLGLSPIQLAITCTKWDLVLMMLARVNDKYTASTSLARRLLNFISRNPTNRSECKSFLMSMHRAMYLAIQKKETEVLDALLKLTNLQSDLSELYQNSKVKEGLFFAVIASGNVSIVNQLASQPWASAALSYRNALNRTAIDEEVASQKRWDLLLAMGAIQADKFDWSDSMLYEAIRGNRLDVVDTCFKVKKMIYSPWTDLTTGNTVFHLIVLKNNVPLFKKIFELYNSSTWFLYSENKECMSVLELAIERQQWDMVALITRVPDLFGTHLGRDEDDSRRYQKTLFLAVQKQHGPTIDFLLNIDGSDAALKKMYERHTIMTTVLHVAVSTGNRMLLRRLLNKSWASLALKQLNQAGFTVPVLAAKEKKWDMVLDMLATLPLETHCDAVIYWAVEDNRQDVVDKVTQVLIPGGTVIWHEPVSQNTLLHLAVEKNDAQLLTKVLAYRNRNIDHFVAKNKDKLTPIALALQYGHWDLISIFVDKINSIIGPAKQNLSRVSCTTFYQLASEYKKLLFQAVLMDNITIIERVLLRKEFGQEFMHVSEAGKGLLHVVLQKRNLQMFQLLSDNWECFDLALFQADITGLTPVQLLMQPNKQGVALIDELIQANHWEWLLALVKRAPSMVLGKLDMILLEAGKHLMAVNNALPKELIEAVLDNKTPSLALLPEANTGNTVLHYAVEQGCTRLLERLVSYYAGSDQGIQNKAGDFPITMALRLKRWDLMLLLLQAPILSSCSDAGVLILESAFEAHQAEVVSEVLNRFFTNERALKALTQSKTPAFQFLGSLKRLELYYEECHKRYPANKTLPIYIGLVQASLVSGFEFMMAEAANDKTAAADRFRQHMQRLMKELNPYSADLPYQFIKNAMNLIINVLLYASIIGIVYMRRYEANHHKPYRFFRAPAEEIKETVEKHYQAVML